MPLLEAITLTSTIKWGMTGVIGMSVGTIGYVAKNFRSVPANKFMAKTGPFVKGVSVSRQTIQWPFQKIKEISMEPINYHFLGSNMSKELVPFKLPLTFTVSPRHPEHDMEGFIRYATRLGDMDDDAVKHIIGGIVNGETRGFVGGMTIQEIFSDKEAFKKQVVDRVQKDLDQFGLEIHNANIEEMHDTEGNSYFENLKMKALEGANTQSRIAVSEARKEGNIGEKEREVITRKQQAVLEADAKEIETIQNQKISNYDRELEITYTNNKKQKEVVNIDAHKEVELNRISVESELNKNRQQQELELLRSSHLTKATAETEAMLKREEAKANAIKIQAEADAIALKIKAEADANIIRIKAEADATATKIKEENDANILKIKAEAESKAIEMTAGAQFYAKSKEADGIRAVLEASAQGLEKIYEVSQTNPELANFYLALEKGIFNSDGLFSVMADKQAKAINGLNPKINIWTTGNQENTLPGVITDLVKTLPPIIDVVEQQTGITLPNFMVNKKE